jgi:hypothetical protein
MLNAWVGVVQKFKWKENEKSVGRGKMFGCPGRKPLTEADAL